MMYFQHGGKIGDLIYALPVIRALGGGTLFMGENKKGDFPLASKEALLPLLQAQSYIKDVYMHVPDGAAALDLSVYLGHWGFVSQMPLWEGAARWLGLPVSIADDPWLKVRPRYIARTVYCRSLDRNTHSGNGNSEQYPDHYESVFLGSPAEYVAFAAAGHDGIRYWPTANLLEAAEIIAGCEKFYSNTTGLLAVALGVGKKPMHIERSPLVSRMVPEHPFPNRRW